MSDPLPLRGHKLIEELIEYKTILTKAGLKPRDIQKLRPLAIPVGEIHRFQAAVGSDQPPAKVGLRCELLGLNVIVCDDLERLR